MVAAHRAGIAYARELDASLASARRRAASLYPDNLVLDTASKLTEQETFLAGYLGQLRRMTAKPGDLVNE
jgi:hypothetical protein